MSSRRQTMTARAAVLAVAIATVVLALALPLKIYLGQQAKVASLAAQSTADQKAIASLRHQLRQWSSPPYIESQAQQRLHMVLPGQRAYVVLGGTAEAQAEARGAGAAGAGGASRTWFGQLWTSMQSAGSPRTARGG